MLNVNEIMAKEINGENDWLEISSKGDLTQDEMEIFKNQLSWETLVRFNKLSIGNKLLIEAIENNKLVLRKDSLVLRHIFKHLDNELEFVIKYKKHLTAKIVAVNTNLKKSEIIKIFGKPQTGEGMTMIIGSDCYPFTVIESNPKKSTITVQADNAIPDKENGYDYFSNQVYKYERNENGTTHVLKFNKNGSWVSDGLKFVEGRSKYQDPSF